MDDRTDATDLALTPANLRDSYPTDRYRGQIRERITIPTRSADHVPPDDVLPATLAARLPVDLWSHQAEALEALADGENVCVSTSTSSGKTYVYGLEIARRALENPDVRALLVYPTKALSRDQRRELAELFDDLGLDLTVGVYDGDTDPGDKARIREEANVVITNVAGLNQYLEGHHRWAGFHANCELVVVDEAHSWTGVSGMHAAWILRRARRVIDWYGGDPQYVLTSATIGNPGEHAAALTGEPATVIDGDGSPRGRRHLVFWEPPERSGDDGEIPSKRPATVEAPELWAHCCYHGVPSLLFCDSRKATELAVDRATDFVENPTFPYAGSVALEPYNAGHGKRARRETERRLKSGDLDGVATTSALEVGIDVGGIDGTLLMGYPGSRSSFWQRIGRAGRGTRDALSVFVPDQATLDGYVSRHPEYLLENDPEDAVVDLENHPVFLQHLRCAAQELPVTRDDADTFGGRDRLERAVAYGRKTGDLEGSLAGGVTYARRDRPQDDISLYATGGTTFDVRVAGEGSIDHEPIGEARAYRDYHEGATVLHRGDRYEVRELRADRPQPSVELEPVDVDYYTQSQRRVAIHDTEVRESRAVEAAAENGFQLNRGYGTVTVRYPTYTKRDVETGEVLETGLETGTLPVEMRTQLCWAEVPTGVERAVTETHSDYRNEECVDLPPRLHGYLGGIHAIEHAMIGVAPLELTVDSNDLGGLATNRLPDAPDTSGWFIYDGVEGGLGFSRRIYEEFEDVARRARELIVDCDCGRDEGCPACLMSDRCGNDNRPLYGPAATDVIDALLGERGAELADLEPTAASEETSESEEERRRPPASVS
ncbi:DEAD/DEAH box helicase [Halobiforma lacisalsi AJ5]|uniref:DEAD/DEAH box helicase n=1 Tax=Natronobacterium lacisalsi AJ5 TaxID=358396 RepID=M0LGV3_NATLA|nr:DEAD/DEAH box helicase [Halobiforma lacisalsi]APW99526.1 DEAD/DEAH box helicase [Halobiforma lacisalsi AJ5]EMA31649.1 DEAD/DEAH box helicase domain protein [Halobiforma lacisalsi AJ5]